MKNKGISEYFEEDWCRVENKAVQQHINMFYKAAINLIKLFKSKSDSKKSISRLRLIVLLILILF